ncbi:hypothetical protein [Azospirillum sp. sgz302134]
MAAPSTRLSFTIPWPEGVSRHAIALARAVDAIGFGQVDPDDDRDAAEWITFNGSSDAVFTAARAIHAEVGTDTGCAWSLDEAGRLWVRDGQGRAAVDAVVGVIRATLRTFGRNDHVGFAWADTSPRPSADTFGGGATVVTRHAVNTFCTAQWLQQQLCPQPAQAAA